MSMGWANRPDSGPEFWSSWLLDIFGGLVATSVCPANEQPRTWGGKRRGTKTLLLFGRGSTGSNRPTGEHKQALRTTRESNRCKEEARLWLLWSKRRTTSIRLGFCSLFGWRIDSNVSIPPRPRTPDRSPGVWADATVLCRRPLDEWIDAKAAAREGFFAYAPEKGGKAGAGWAGAGWWGGGGLGWGGVGEISLVLDTEVDLFVASSWILRVFFFGGLSLQSATYTQIYSMAWGVRVGNC